MPKRPLLDPLEFVNIHGKPLGGLSSVFARSQPAPAVPAAPAPPKAPARPAAPDEGLTQAEIELVFDALVLAGARRGKTALMHLLRAMQWRRERGRAFNGDEVGQALARLAAAGRVQLREGEGALVPRAVAEPRLAELLRRPESAGWWRPWLWVAHGTYGPIESLTLERTQFAPRNGDEALALSRLVLISGIDAAAYVRIGWGLRGLNDGETLMQALGQLHRIGLAERIEPALHWQLMAGLDQHGLLTRQPALLAWVNDNLERAPAGAATGVRLRIAEQRLHAGDAPGIERALGRDPEALPFAPLLAALLPARDGRWAEAAAAFPPAWKALTAALGKRRGIAPQSVLQLYPLALMAAADAGSWTTARKFCVAMSGSRDPHAFDDWGRWAHVLAVRLGDARFEPRAFEAGSQGLAAIAAEPDRMADRVLLAAWLGQPPPGWQAPAVHALALALANAGLPWKALLLAEACERLGWPLPSAAAGLAASGPRQPFIAARRDAWREALAAITALGGGSSAAAAEKPAATLHWRLTLDDERRPFHLEAFEPAASARGKAKPLSMAQLKRRTRLDTRDAAVARCLRTSPYGRQDPTLDLVGATLALVGHPALELAGGSGSAGIAVDLQESLPVLEVQRERAAGAAGGADAAPAEHFVFRLRDRLAADEPPELDHHHGIYDADAAEEERRDSLRVLAESPDRARVVRITAAHRRVAELIAQGWAVPVNAGAELDAALRVLAGHFVLHSDADAGEPVASDARLVAQLQPRGDAMRVALHVRPFGDFGPLLAAGQGRARLITMHRGVSLATVRDLAAEAAHLGRVREALPALEAAEPLAAGVAGNEWLLDEPEQVLAAVQALGTLAADAQALRALEWPKGRPLRVHEPAATAFSTTLATGRDWFGLNGELRIDEQRVLSLKQLLGLLHEGRGSRYVALGNGEYLALAERLRQRLAELAAVADADGEGFKLGATAAVWLADAAPDLGVAGDAAWRTRAAQLEAAGALEPEVPHGLQATLRPYQREGFVWLMRLAAAGFGAILADDMGLGKTIQTLAVLLARAAAGPALVLAPTSVCSNWADEIGRFAPGLRPAVYGQGDADGDSAGRVERGNGRAAAVANAAAGDVLVVSYALLLRDAEAFAAREGGWATLVLDEAQALKNAATQRVQAVAALAAGFRLALSGTPVENRLADLWSIMNLVNPGLLGNQSRFAERFGNPIERQRSEPARQRLRRLVAPFLLRRTKAQVLADLPPRTEIVQRIEPHADERAFLEAMRRRAVERIAALDPADARSRFNVLAELTRLRRAACDPRLAAPELGQPGAKVQAFERLAAELVEGRHQALVFSQFTDFLKLLAERLDAAGLRYQYLDGGTPAAARGERVAAFQRGEADLFLISLKAGGFGLNLTAADYVVIADPWWNPAAEDQAMGRAHRIGQQRPVTVYRLVTAGSIEERIVAMHHDKRELAEGLLAGQDGGVPPSAGELMELLKF